jgi:hypothetical protein
MPRLTNQIHFQGEFFEYEEGLQLAVLLPSELLPILDEIRSDLKTKYSKSDILEILEMRMVGNCRHKDGRLSIESHVEIRGDDSYIIYFFESLAKAMEESACSSLSE